MWVYLLVKANKGFKMKADKAIATYSRMRKQPLWRLLASTNGPVIIGLLQSHLYDNERSLPASIMHERIGRDLESLRSQGEDLPQTAQAYIAHWVSEGFLERRFPPEVTCRVLNSRIPPRQKADLLL